jgi:2',3'-cyclic-nucleotide 2'-phosphodiesterase
MPKILFLGDIVGRPGRDAVRQRASALRSELGLDLIVANGENAAAGAGLTAGIAAELLGAGVDALTLGDHVWDQRNFESEIGALERVCRPANLPPQCPGRTYLVVTSPSGFRLGLFTVLGRNYINLKSDCPFAAADRILREHGSEAQAWIVEAHMEATSEKVAMGWYLDGRCAAVFGSHTHIPTADTTLRPRGTAYQTDLGMSGPYASVIGRDVQVAVARFLDGMPRKSEVATGDVRLCGCIVEVDAGSGLALNVKRFEESVNAA